MVQLANCNLDSLLVLSEVAHSIETINPLRQKINNCPRNALKIIRLLKILCTQGLSGGRKRGYKSFLQDILEYF